MFAVYLFGNKQQLIKSGFKKGEEKNKQQFTAHQECCL